MDNISTVIPLIILLVILALVGKIVGCGVSARAFWFDREESFALGCAMCGRGALELVLVSFGLGAGLINETLFTTLVMVTVITVIITPILYTIAENRIKD